MKIFIIILLLPVLLYAQFTNDDQDLVKTTFERSFNKRVISNYLNAGGGQKVNAALLSISNSEDTSFIPDIISLQFAKHAEYICFALGQLGSSSISSDYVWSKLHSDDITKFSRYLFEALGKVGSEDDLKKIITLYANFDGPSFPYSGISLAVYQFAFRGIKNESSIRILIDEIDNPITPVESKNDALFALARLGNSEKINDELKRILLLHPSENPDTVKLKQFALMNLRVEKFFPQDKQLFSLLLTATNPLLLIEAAKSLVYYNFNSTDDVLEYLKLLDNGNPNVSVSAAASLKNITLPIGTEDSLKSVISKLILKKNLAANTKGELFLSYTKLFPKSDVTPFLDSIDDRFYYDYLGSNTQDKSSLLFLLRKYEIEENLAEKIDLLSNILNFQESFSQNKNLYEAVINSLSSGFAPLVSIAADGIDSLLIIKDRGKLITIIQRQIAYRKNDPDFMEGIMSLTYLAERIDSSLFTEVIDELNESNLYSIRKFIADKSGQKLKYEKPLQDFNEIWRNAFTYKTANVETEKGNFTIEFLPRYAPVSVGNFCKLAGKGFYNGIEFHRVVPGFVIQCGDPSATGWGGPGYDIISEFSPLPYDIGMVGMASAGKDTEGSQWFVMQGNYPHLNGRYTIFARVTKGMDVVYKIDQDTKIINVTLLP